MIRGILIDLDLARPKGRRWRGLNQFVGIRPYPSRRVIGSVILRQWDSGQLSGEISDLVLPSSSFVGRVQRATSDSEKRRSLNLYAPNSPNRAMRASLPHALAKLYLYKRDSGPPINPTPMYHARRAIAVSESINLFSNKDMARLRFSLSFRPRVRGMRLSVSPTPQKGRRNPQLRGFCASSRHA